MTTSNQLEEGIVFARAVFAQLDCRGTKWKTRNVPVHIRKHLWVSHYLTEKSDEQLLYVIRPPDKLNPKVHFARWPPLEPA
ncbi:hypothetical protein ACS5NO_17525 [Larkinella sp. GY13]